MYVVTYAVKYSEPWCADECHWVERTEMVEAETPRKAQRAFREATKHLRRCIVGRHINTREAE